jgi:hypothetical protein
VGELMAANAIEDVDLLWWRWRRTVEPWENVVDVVEK